MSILADILKAKQAEVSEMEEISEAPACKRRNFVEALRSQQPSFIAEIKPKSPSSGELLSPQVMPEVVNIYKRHATVISVLCDKQFFGGGFDLLKKVAAQTDKPLLAKEFIISEKQIVQAAINGASGVLLIATILDVDTLTRLVRETIRAGLCVLLELHTADDIKKAATSFKELHEEERSKVVLGINNRDLETLEISLKTTTELAPQIRRVLGADNLLISESGVSSPEDVRILSEFVDGFLVGTSILKSDNPESFFSSLIAACDRR